MSSNVVEKSINFATNLELEYSSVYSLLNLRSLAFVKFYAVLSGF